VDFAVILAFGIVVLVLLLSFRGAVYAIDRRAEKRANGALEAIKSVDLAVRTAITRLRADMILARTSHTADRPTHYPGEIPAPEALAYSAAPGISGPAEPSAAQQEPAKEQRQAVPAAKDAKVLPFRRREKPCASESIEDPPSGESERIETLADVIRLIAHTLPTDSRDAMTRSIAAMFRENPNADMDTDSGPMWIATLNHFLPGNVRATLTEVYAEYNRRAEEHNRRLDEEEASVVAEALPAMEARLTPTQISPAATPPPSKNKKP
jgi:hypothetical protein